MSNRPQSLSEGNRRDRDRVVRIKSNKRLASVAGTLNIHDRMNEMVAGQTSRTREYAWVAFTVYLVS